MYTYDNIKYKSHNEVPFDASDLKFIKQMANWGKPDKLKDKRVLKIQHCYAMILKKGLKNIPDCWSTIKDLSYWLEVDGYKCSEYLEPLKLAKTIYLETYEN